MNRFFCLVLLGLIFQGCFIEGYEPYRAQVTVDDVTGHVRAPNLVDLNRELKTSSLVDLIPIYTPVSPVSMQINLRGLVANAAFATGSTTLVFTVPNSNIIETFTGGTRDESLILMKEFIKEGRSIKKLLKGYTRYSPIDPIAGNPKSLISEMADSDYKMGHLYPFSGCGCYEAQPVVHQFQAGFNVGRAFAHEFDTTSVAIPFRYSYSPNLRWALILDAPLEYYRNGGASSIFLSIGTGVRLPITESWSLTTMARMGSGGSLDLCTSGNFVGGGVTSVYNLKICDYVASLTNYAGYLASTNLWLTGINFNYHLKSFVFKNGLSIVSCSGFSLWERTFHLKAEIKDTYFANSRLFINHYDEVSFALIAPCLNPCLSYDCLTTEFAFQWGQKGYKGYQLNIVYQF